MKSEIGKNLLNLAQSGFQRRKRRLFFSGSFTARFKPLIRPFVYPVHDGLRLVYPAKFFFDIHAPIITDRDCGTRLVHFDPQNAPDFTPAALYNLAMGKDDKLDDFIRSIERLSISAEDEAFLMDVRRQFKAEVAATLASDQDRPDATTTDQ